MDEALRRDWPADARDRQLAEVVERDRSHLRNFIRKRVPDRADAEDILQDVCYELVESYRAMKPIEEVTAWLFRVARNRIIDLFRRKAREAQRAAPVPADEDGELLSPELLLPSADDGPEAAYARGVLLEELEDALEELPEEQRDVFIAHELMGFSFKDLARETGLSLNTLLARKHYAIKHLRRRLRWLYDDFRK